MDQQIRNKLQRATQDARRLLEHEFAEQLEGTYDILPDGKILPDPGKHLDDRGRLIRQKLVDAIEHIRAGGKKPAEAVDEYTREAAFTFLNRFVALKMLEARELLQQCVSKGDQSAGFREFTGLAPGLAELPDKGYRLYLECLFDELSIEVKMLFDRRDVASLLWPRQAALDGLLGILNDPELAGVWDQDETIGWVYQYFNSQEERRKMREESQAPRNSRELAVRNQFFTPRYVVEFLTDNTLGRIWYEMRQGNTRLKEQCRYLVRRPTEIFLKEGEQPPEQPTDETLSQEELLKQPVHIPYRAKKDPRALKILDPACGSGHFLLYCFVLLLTIYEEAWADEHSPKSEITSKTLREDYPTIEALREAVPGLILRHNLHGIDIDPRCAQIAAFALWMRAQRAFNDFGLDRASRPAIRKTNIVVAEPMPGEKDLLKEFTATLQPPLLGQLVEVIFDKMQLAGEAGSLLKIEEELRDAIAKAREQWGHGPKAEQLKLFADDRQKLEQLRFDLSGITDDLFWQEAESRTIAALRHFAEARANGAAFRRTLFAEDAARGLAFIDLCRKRYDAVLMNPPFGEYAYATQAYIDLRYPDTYIDAFASFVDRGTELAPSGAVGAITPRAFLATKTLERWRRTRVIPGLSLLVDMGFEVLDGSMVETCAYVLAWARPHDRCLVLDLRQDRPAYEAALDQQLLKSGSTCSLRRECRTRQFLSLPRARILHWLPASFFDLLRDPRRFDPLGGTAKNGLQTYGDERFLRLYWEVPSGDVGRARRWVPIAKGGEYETFYYPLHLVMNYWENGRECGAVNFHDNGQIAQTRRNAEYYYRPALTYPSKSTRGFSVRQLPRECLFALKGPAIIPSSEALLHYLLGWINSHLIRTLVSNQASTGEYLAGIIQNLPWRTPTQQQLESVGRRAVRVGLNKQRVYSLEETEPTFARYWPGTSVPRSIAALAEELRHYAVCIDEENAGLLAEMNRDIETVYGVNVIDPEEWDLRSDDHQLQLSKNIFSPHWCAASTISVALGCAFGRWSSEAVAGGNVLPMDSDLFASVVIAPMESACTCVAGERISAHGESGRAIPTGIMVDDSGHSADVIGAISLVLAAMWGELSEKVYGELVDILAATGASGGNLRPWIRQGFFDDHIERYSKSRRKAPIYWQLATPSASYSVWLYYQRFTPDTFYRVLNDYVKPKLEHERRKLDQLQVDAGSEPTRSQRGEIDQQETFVTELKTFAEEIERIAPLWNPDLNDGVIINFAPLWRLVPQHKAWQRECKECWDKLVAGEYDWAHLAMHLWPERAVPKCRTDASLAIAHGVEDVFWDQDAKGKWIAKPEPDEGWDALIERLVDERTKPAVKAALKSLLEAPTPGGNGRGRKTGGRRRART